MSEPDYAKQYEELKRQLAEQGFVPPEGPPNDPASGVRYRLVASALAVSMGFLLGSGLLTLAAGLAEADTIAPKAVLLGVTVLLLLGSALTGRSAARRYRAITAADRRFDEWVARGPGGKEELRARFRRAMITAIVGCTGMFVYHLVTRPLFGVMVIVGTGVVLAPFVPYIRRQYRWYRNLTRP